MEIIDGQNPPRVTFANGVEYMNFFRRLIELESDFRTVDESYPITENLTLRWSWDAQIGRMCAYFSTRGISEWRPAHGQRCELRGDGTGWMGFGRVFRVPQVYGDEVGLQMEENEYIPDEHPTTGYSLYLINMTTIADRMLSALSTFSFRVEDNLCTSILGNGGNNAITGLPEWNNFDLIATLPPSSVEQANIVKNVMENQITLIDGFAGSGKTTTLLSIVHHLLKENQGRIVVCGPTNSIVDHLALNIYEKIEPSVVRFFPVIRHSNTRASALSPEGKFRDYLPPEFRQLQERVDGGEENISDADMQRLREERAIAKKAAWNNAKVICCTCLSAGNEQLSLMEFGTIIIDDSMQAVEPECLIPIALGCKRLVLVGEELQLKPIIHSGQAAEGGLNQSLFKRLSIRIPPLCLTKQFRMHPKLWDCVKVNYLNLNETDYGVNEDQRTFAYAWSNPNYPFQLINSTGWESRVALDEFRFRNTTEVLRVSELTIDLINNYQIAPDRIGIITQFDDQKYYLKRQLEEMGIPVNTIGGIEVDKIDHYQGREKDIIIVSCVRTTNQYSYGALKYKDRFNLTLTRARLGLFIVANVDCLYNNEQNADLRPVLNYYHQHVERLPFLN